MALESQELRKAGLKVTLPRVKVYQILEKATEGDHWSAEDIYKLLIEQDEDVGLATVYRVLTQFEAAGLIIRHNFTDGHAVFELDSGDHHDHIVCLDCGVVTEFVDATIENRQSKVAQEYGFEIDDHSMTIYGRCQKKRCPNREPI